MTWCLILSVIVLAIAYVIFNYVHIKGMNEGTDEMKEMAQIIRDGANTFIKTHYKVSSNNVTQRMIDEAQRLIHMLASVDNIYEFNSLLIKIFSSYVSPLIL